MVMNDTLVLVLAGIAGGALCIFFFGGLWWTVRKTLASGRPALWVFGSLLLRMGVTLAGFYSNGEIGSAGKQGQYRLHNQTMSISVLGEDME